MKRLFVVEQADHLGEFQPISQKAFRSADRAREELEEIKKLSNLNMPLRVVQYVRKFSAE